MDLLDRLGPRMLVGDDCWEWIGPLNNKGYGQVSLKGRSERAHRVVYELLVGPIPEGMTLDHVCHNKDTTCEGGPTCSHRRCVRPDHLKPASMGANQVSSLNTLTGRNVRKTHCPHGHPYSGDNLGFWNEARYCKTCCYARAARWRAKRKQEKG